MEHAPTFIFGTSVVGFFLNEILVVLLLGWAVVAITLTLRNGRMERPSHLAQLYGFTVCLTSLITILFTLPEVLLLGLAAGLFLGHWRWLRRLAMRVPASSRVCLLLGFLVAGCATWRPYDTGAGLSAGQSLPYRLRATRQDSTRLALTAPFVRADTLYGGRGGDTVAVALAEITRLERERVSIERTLGVAIGIPVVALGITYLVVCGSNQCNPGF